MAWDFPGPGRLLATEPLREYTRTILRTRLWWFKKGILGG